MLTLFYTFEGGMTAVIWTDVVQMSLYVVGRGGQLLRHSGPDSRRMGHVAAVAAAAHKLAIFDFRFAPTMEFFARKYSFWAGAGRRLLPHHRQPRDRSAHGAAPAERARRTRRAARRCWPVGW